MLQNHKLLIDQNCPMCSLYGQCFTKIKLVDEQTIAPYQTIEEQYAKHIDMSRARNEIALFDTQSQQTLYGYEALIAIVTQRSIIAKKILSIGLVRWVFVQLYLIISYNRKVIVPSQGTTGFRTCVPDERPLYRWGYIGFVAFATGFILNQFVYIINTELGQPHSAYREYVVCVAQICWQFTAIQLIAKNKHLEYLGNMSTVSMMGGLLLIPVLIINSFVHFHIYLLIGVFLAIVILMLLEHIRRCSLLYIPLTMTYSWVIFRLTALFIIIIVSL